MYLLQYCNISVSDNTLCTLWYATQVRLPGTCPGFCFGDVFNCLTLVSNLQLQR